MARCGALVAALVLLACEPGVKPGGHLVILGDSIAQQAGEELVYEGVQRDWGYDFANNSIIGMGACPAQQYNATGAGYSGIDDYLPRRIAALEDVAHRDAWVIELGTNDGGHTACVADYRAQAIDPILDAVPDGTPVFWLTVSVRAGPAAAIINAALLAHPDLEVLDYAAHFDGHPEWFNGSGVHLNEAGQTEFANWLFGELDERFPDP